jgi:hypothetical protein
MIKPEQVPKSSVENAIATFTVEGASWEDVIAAAINAWPGAHERTDDWCTPPDHNLILPLTQENSND